MPPQTKHAEYDAIRPDGRAIAEVKFSVDALRTVRTALINLAYALEQHPDARGYLVLVDPTITEGRLHDEWHRAAAVLKPHLLTRLTICLVSADSHIRGVPQDPPADVRRWLTEVIEHEATNVSARAERIDFEFVILKLLIHQWLIKREPVTTAWLSHAAGCSYPTVARVLKGHGSLVERQSDRRVALRYFPEKEFSRLLAKSERARSTTRFVDQSGQPRSPEMHLKRLEKLKPEHVAVGGVLGAKHYVPDLDLVGTPRLDLSVQCKDGRFDLDIIKAMDPALKREDDPLRPANVVVHAVRHADSLFSARKGNLLWADPVECLLDLHEAHLEAQAGQFLEELERTRRDY